MSNSPSIYATREGGATLVALLPEPNGASKFTMPTPKPPLF